MKIHLAQRLQYWPRWVLYQLIRFTLSLPLMIMAFVGFIGGAIVLFLSSMIANWAYKNICPLPLLPDPNATARRIVEPM